MRMVDLIIKKRSGEAHESAEIKWIIDEYAARRIPDYQMSAWLMAVFFRGMNDEEMRELTLAMMRSGDVADLSDLPGVKVDKHSTGGVGDTTTLIIAPLAAACGATIAKMSGRGLGFTGGTLDKLESVPGVRVERSIDELKSIVKKTGLCVVGQSGNLTPADKMLYALRDVTGTVESLPLIASSIMSKKLACGADAIVLDVKAGSGAFMQTVEEARKLAAAMVGIGSSLGRRTTAIITDMDQPLGSAVGNGLEVREAIEMLSGNISESDPLYRVSMLLASHMLTAANVAKSDEQARELLRDALSSGAALKKLSDMLTALGAEDAERCIREPDLLLSGAKRIPVTLERGGYILSMRAAEIGRAAMLLGAGRAKKEDDIDPAVGLCMHKRRGDAIRPDEAVATLYVRDESAVPAAMEAVRGAILTGSSPPEPMPIVHGIIT